MSAVAINDYASMSKYTRASKCDVTCGQYCITCPCSPHFSAKCFHTGEVVFGFDTSCNSLDEDPAEVMKPLHRQLP